MCVLASGYDVHKFTEGDHIWLCGLKVPHSHGLEGHSDADVGLHAITDAVLGCIGEGDIGMHFPAQRCALEGRTKLEVPRSCRGAGA